MGLSVALGIFLYSASQSREHRLSSVLWAAQGEPGVWLLLRDKRGLKNKTSNKRGVTVRSDLKWSEHDLLIMFH